MDDDEEDIRSQLIETVVNYISLIARLRTEERKLESLDLLTAKTEGSGSTRSF